MIYEIKNDRFTAQVDSLGAQLLSLKDETGFERIWVADPNYWHEHAPVLFPIVGALREDKVKIGGSWVTMGRHGFAKRTQFQQAQEGEGSIALTLTPTEATKACYPFDFALTVAYQLTEEGYITTFTVENTGDQPMPYVIGGHPGFNLPVGEGKFEDYTIQFERDEDQKCPVIEEGSCLINYEDCAYQLQGREIPLRHDLFYRDALVFDGLRSGWVRVVDKATGRGVEMDFSQFPMLGIWSAKNDGPYVCLEPWTGCATLTTEGDDYEQKKGMVFLAPGEKQSHAFTVKFL